MQTTTFPITNFNETKQQLLAWANQYNSCCFLDNHQYPSAWNQQECLVGVGSLHSLECNAGTAFSQLQLFLDTHKSQWFFGHLGYGLSAEIEQIAANTKPIANSFPDLFFFIPETVVSLSSNGLTVLQSQKNANKILQEILAETILQPPKTNKNKLGKWQEMGKEKYIKTIEKLKEHILKGHCYEINFCQHFLMENAEINPLEIYQNLTQISPNPFASFYKMNQQYLLCASPERYLCKTDDSIFSQPIKGTASRYFFDEKKMKKVKNNCSKAKKNAAKM